jgi:hypothetical protein
MLLTTSENSATVHLPTQIFTKGLPAIILPPVETSHADNLQPKNCSSNFLVNPALLVVAARLQFERKIKAKCIAVYQILVSSA